MTGWLPSDCPPCKGCYGDSCNPCLEPDECQNRIVRPLSEEDGPCPFYNDGIGIRNLPQQDLSGHLYAVTRRMAELIARGINTRQFCYWPICVYTPTIGTIETSGECTGIYISTRPYGKRDEIFVRTPHCEISGIVAADIEEDKLILRDSESPFCCSRIVIDIVDIPSVIPAIPSPEIPTADKGQKTLEGWC